MKKALLILAVAAFATTAFAADASKGIEKGDKALLFSASGFDAKGYGGVFSIGAKYYISNGLALRPAVQFVHQSRTEKQEPDTVSFAPWRRTYADSKEKTTMAGLSLGVEKSLFTKGAVTVYTGGTAGFGLESSPEEEGYTDVNAAAGTTRVRTWKTERSSTTFNFGAILGAEVLFTDNVSLGGEYQFGLGVGSEDTDETTYTETSTTGTTTTITTAETKNPLNSTTTIGFGAIGLVLGIRF